SVRHGISDPLPFDDLIVYGLKIKTKTAVLCFHPGRILAPFPQIVLGGGAAPFIGGKVPIDDMLRFVPEFPYLIRWGTYGGLHFYLFVFHCFAFEGFTRSGHCIFSCFHKKSTPKWRQGSMPVPSHRYLPRYVPRESRSLPETGPGHPRPGSWE